MTGGKFRIRMEAYDHQALDASAREIVDQAKRTGARVARKKYVFILLFFFFFFISF